MKAKLGMPETRPRAWANPNEEAPPFRPRVQRSNGDVVVYVYGEIGWDFQGKAFAETLSDTDGDRIRLHINSFGGDAWTGVAAYNVLRREERPVVAYVDGEAASAASVILMGADERNTPKSGKVMIHNAWTITIGNAEALRKAADSAEALSEQLAVIYSDRTDTKLETVREWMNAETEMYGEGAVKAGFCTDLIEGTAQASTAPKGWVWPSQPKPPPQSRPAFERALKQRAEME